MKRLFSLIAGTWLLSAVLASTGCSTKTGTFDVTIANNSGQYVSDIIVDHGTQSLTFGLIPPGETQTQRIRIDSSDTLFIDYLDADGRNWTRAVKLDLEPSYLGRVLLTLEPEGVVSPRANINVRR